MSGGANPAYSTLFILLQSSRMGGVFSMKQSFQDLEQSLSQTSTELLGRMAEIQKLRLAVKQAVARYKHRPLVRAPKIESGVNQSSL
jgi:uncharacterized membrane-anchored protein YhcB (DUF1043 family)